MLYRDGGECFKGMQNKTKCKVGMNNLPIGMEYFHYMCVCMIK